MLPQPCEWGCGPVSCTIVQHNWSRGDECNAAFPRVVNEQGGSIHALAIGRRGRYQDAGKHLPFDSQSAQNLFSSSASKELRTAWYLSTSFTDLPVIIAMVHLLHTAPTVRAGSGPIASNLTKWKRCVQSRCAPIRSSSSSSMLERSEFVSPRWDDCLSANQNAGYSRCK